MNLRRSSFVDQSSECRVPRYGKAFHHLLSSQESGTMAAPSDTDLSDGAAGLTLPTGETSDSQPLFVRSTPQSPELDAAVPDLPFDNAGTAILLSEPMMIMVRAVAEHDRMSVPGLIGYLVAQRAEAVGLAVLARAIADRGELTEVPVFERIAASRFAGKGGP